LFIADQAPYSIAKYQREKIGDQNITVSKWNVTSPCHIRNISFLHPLKNSIGPTKAKTTREQKFQRFGSHGMTLGNSTVVEGIPAADCFRIEDVWIIQRDPTSSCRLVLTVSFRMVFTKRTMLKSLIQRNIRQETKNWFKGYTTMLQQVLASSQKSSIGGVPPPAPQAPSDDTNVAQEIAELDLPIEAAIPWDLDLVALGKVGLAFLLVLLCLQVWWMRQALLSVQSDMKQVRLQNQQLVLAIRELTAQQCHV
jgi:hypothetical protein